MVLSRCQPLVYVAILTALARRPILTCGVMAVAMTVMAIGSWLLVAVTVSMAVAMAVAVAIAGYPWTAAVPLGVAMAVAMAVITEMGRLVNRATQ